MAGVPSEKSATRKDDPDALTCTDFGPESKSINIAGRPVQLLIVTHAGAPAREWDSYFRFSLWPLKPIYLLGVTGGEEPAEDVPPAHAVSNGGRRSFLITWICLQL